MITKIYESPEGKKPYLEWFKSIKDKTIRGLITAKVFELRAGNFNRCKSLGGGLYELKLFFGAGYRVYFARVGDQILLLLGGGTKNTKGEQQRDILKAKRHYMRFKKTLCQ